MANFKRKHTKQRVDREQPRKDSKSKRINLDNERVSRLERDLSDKKSTDNDISWYSRNPQLLKSAASFYNFVPTGTKPSADIPIPIPGVFALYCVPSFTPTAVEALNISGDSLYSYIVHANSRNTSYEAVDLMQIIIAAANIFALYALGVRAYGVSRNYNGANKYEVDAVLKASGFNPDTVRDNQSQWLYMMNDFAAQLHQIWIPNTMSFVDRWVWMNSNVYQDSESVKGQMYVMTMNRYLVYDPKGTSNGGSLKWVKTGGGMVTQGTDANTDASYQATKFNSLNDYKNTLQYMIDKLMGIEDRGVIMGDILKAFGPDRIFAVNEVPTDYKVTPVYNREVLTQIENAIMYPTIAFQINQEGSKLKPNYGQNTPASINYDLQIPKQTILNFHQVSDPTPEQIVIATRLMVSGYNNTSISTNTNKTLEPGVTGTEYVENMRIFSYDINDALTTYDLHQFVSSTGVPGNIDLISNFDWAPIFYGTHVAAAPGNTTGLNIQRVSVGKIFGDIDNYTVIDMDSLKKIHRMAIYSEFDLPVQM